MSMQMQSWRPKRALTPDAAREIFAAKGEITAKALADVHGISVAAVSKIWRGVAYGEATRDLRRAALEAAGEYQ